MKIQLISQDSPLPNHALMVLSTWHKSRGDEVILSEKQDPQWGDVQYRSILFRWGKGGLPAWGINGGPGWDPEVVLSPEVEWLKPDYSLYEDIDTSWGYTFRGCSRRCEYCFVPRMPMSRDFSHHSIREFVDPKLPNIVLLNNNTFLDVRWRETFEEIWEMGLVVWDMNGYDARILDEEKVEYMRKTKWKHGVHFAFDNTGDEEMVIRACRLLEEGGLKGKTSWYTMLGWKYSKEQDMARLELLRGLGFPAVPTLYNKNDPWSCKVKRWALNRGLFFGIPFSEWKDDRELKMSRMSVEERERDYCRAVFRGRGKSKIRG